MKKSKLLFVSSILLVIFGGLMLLDVIESLEPREWLSEYAPEVFTVAGSIICAAINFLLGAAELTGGILGILSYKKPYQYKRFLIILGIIMLVLIAALFVTMLVLIPNISSNAVQLLQEELQEYDSIFSQDGFNMIADSVIAAALVMATLVSAVVPTLYLIGAVRHNKFSHDIPKDPENNAQ